MEYRPLGTSGLQLPTVGMGTLKTFDVVQPTEIHHRRHVCDAALESGANLFDTSPMYGHAEIVLAKALEGRRDQAIVATKVWTADDAEAAEQIRRAFQYYRDRVEIYQVHNLVKWQTRLKTLDQLRGEGRITSVGVTH